MPASQRHIVVEGPIGVGKTSLARRLADTLGGWLLQERAEENPFLPGFYQDQRQGALPAQLFFLFQRARQMQELRQADLFHALRIADFMLEKDRLFAALTLEEQELALYNQVYAALAPQAPPPDLVVYLQAPAEVLLERITTRGIAYERQISTAYLQRLCEAYTTFFHHYQEAPLLIVNAAAIDLVHNDQDYAALVQRIQGIHSGRHYFNPLPVSF